MGMFWLLSSLLVAAPVHAAEEAAIAPHEGALIASALVEDPHTRALLEAARSQGGAYRRLVDLCDNIGARLAGSAALERAVQWSLVELKSAGATSAWTEEVMVPHWERGEESATMLSPRVQEMSILGLGGTVSGSVEAEVVVINDLENIGPEVAGKIALFNIPMQEGVPAVKRYGQAVATRLNGPSLAAEAGAVAAMVRSVTTRSLDTPHTGATRYAEGKPRIPAVAVTVEDAMSMARIVEAGGTVRVRLSTGGVHHPDALSHNVMGEIKGSKYPREIVLIGAHLDSWDVGQGAHDDGAGVVEVIEALSLIVAAGKAPERTIRVVLFTNEENGVRGGKDYALAHPPRRSERHVAAIESDLGGGAPRFWTAGGSDDDLAWLRRAAAPLGMPVALGGGGADIRALGEQGVLRIGYRPDDTDYFDIHHTRADTIDKIDPAAIAESTAAIAGLAWRLANTER